MIAIGRDAAGKFRWRVGESVEWSPGEQIFMDTVSAVDALAFALREGFDQKFCAALAKAVLDSICAKK